MFEATELFARGVGESTDIVQKEMFTFEDAGGRSLTLRPEGTAPVCRAYLEHGMHKLPQPVKLWYLSSFFRHERAAGRPLPPVLAGRRRGDRLRRPGRRRRDDRAAARAARRARRRAACGCASRASAAPQARADYRERLQAYLRAHEDRSRADVRERIDLNPLRAFDAEDRGTQRGHARGAAAARPPRRRRPRALRRGARAARPPPASPRSSTTLVRGLDYYTRTIFEFTSDALGAQCGVGGGGRYDGLVEQLGGPPTPGMGWAAGVERILLAGERAPAPAPVATCSSPTRTGAHAGASRWPPRRARPGLAAQHGARRALAQGPAAAGRSRRRAIRCDRVRGRHPAARHGQRRAGERRARRRPPSRACISGRHAA